MSENVEATPVAPNVEAPKVDMPIEEKKNEPLPDYFVDPEQKHKIVLDIIFQKKNGKILRIVPTAEGATFEDDIGVSREWFEFTQPTYDEMATYRQRCTVYNSSAQRMIVDGTQLRHYLIVWHMKDWSIKDKSSKKIELKHDAAGTLSDETMKRVYATNPAILDAALNQLEKNLLIQ